MKLYVVYDDSTKASLEDQALKALCQELKKMTVASYLKTITIDPQAQDIERVIQAITSQKEISSNGSIF